jgi:nicotinate phosphoribosyltransferase
MNGDILSNEGDDQAGDPLLVPVVIGGHRVASALTLDELRAHTARELKRLPEAFRRLEIGVAYPVQIGESLSAVAAEAGPADCRDERDSTLSKRNRR